MKCLIDMNDDKCLIYKSYSNNNNNNPYIENGIRFSVHKATVFMPTYISMCHFTFTFSFSFFLTVSA